MSPSHSFLHSHWDNDPLQLLLQAGRYPDVDMRWVAQQIEGRKQAKEKWPSFFENERFEYPPKLNREQSSSEAAARYKAGLIPEGCHLVDMTGGMGVDSYFFAQRAARVDYWERDAELAALVERNMQRLGAENVAVHAGDSVAGFQPALLAQDRSLCSLYLDPARRDGQGRKVQAFEACEPNVLELLPRLREQANCILIKASPMIDIQLACKQLGGSPLQVHIVAVKGECKEVLFLLRELPRVIENYRELSTEIHAVDLWPDHTFHHRFTPIEEAAAEAPLAGGLGRYLCEPHAALMKAGCFNLLAHWYPVQKLARNSHLYASPTPIEEWPGRQFEVLQELPLNAKEVARAIPSKRCHVLSRNHPIGAEELRRKLKVSEGGQLHIVATTLGDKPLGLLCRRIEVSHTI